MPATLENVAGIIRSDEKLKVYTTSYRQTGSKTFKTECPLFAVACLLEGGKGKDNIRGLTGLSIVDFDHIVSSPDATENDKCLTIKALKDRIIADPHTLMCYTTISGNGLRVIFRYEKPHCSSPDMKAETAFYVSAFFTGNAYYERLTGCKTDGQCKNVTRLSGLAHDPDVFLNMDAKPFSATEIEAAHSSNSKRNRENRQEQRIQTYYDTFIAPQLAKDDIVYRSGSHNEYVMRVGYKLAQKRYPKTAAIAWAKRTFADYPDAEQVFRSCYDNTTLPHGRTGNGDYTRYASVDDIKSFLDGCIKLRFNVITSRVEHLVEDKDEWQPITDREVNSLWVKLSQVSKVAKGDIYSIIESDYVPLFNPLLEYLSSLPAADGSDYIRQLAETVSVRGGKKKQELWYRYLKKWLVGMIAGWMSDNVVNNVILVLIGEQGSYKTTWFNYLLPPQLKQYFYTKTNANRMGKDDLLSLAQYGLICYEELDTMRPAELNQLKAAVTMHSIDERAAYAHYKEHRKHIASFCGTGNNVTFLCDPTGNRRWLPFEVDSIVSPREKPFPYEGIYAQAYALFKDGFRFWFNKKEIKEQSSHNKRFEAPSLENELVDLYFRMPVGKEHGEFITVGRALQIISSGISQKLSSVNVGKAFSDLGFNRVRTSRSRGFIGICRSAEEIKAYQRTQSLDAEPDGEEPPS